MAEFVGIPTLINESQVIINLQSFTPGEKKQILYNHIKLGGQERAYKKKIKPFLSSAATNKEFLPEIARRLGNPFFTKGLSLSATSIKSFIEEPKAFMKDIISSLDNHSKATIALIFMNGGRIKSPVFLAERENHAIKLLGSSQHGVIKALDSLNNSLIKTITEDGHRYWKYHHPSISDAFAEYIASNPELLHIYLQGSNLEKLLGEVVCGEIGIQGEKIVLTVDHYSALNLRLKELPVSNQHLMYFLSTKCDSEFLKLFVSEHPELMSPRIGAYLYVYINEIRIAGKLNRYHLLPESNRKQLTALISKITINTPDGTILPSEAVRDLFTDDELEHLKSEIRDRIIPNLEKEIESHEDNYDREDDPEQYFDALRDTFTNMKDLFSDDSDAHDAFHDALAGIENAVKRLNESYEPKPEPDYDDYLEGYGSRGGDEGRSVFDDVDE